ncbi:hypothetical protein CR105_25380 [Massilia eurypsychrophila]|uniref:Caspase family p20 domain-containing protein n=1 Tax=Massilia eurypsychrophila TaxID=1485217 RepID=A0A2G8T816_9BURK|nr:caspase family protein [Massilia eurypsychrophila]PIL42206.1 hypothetical protein CR105_25380 [Massilia eurypsychrophila]
MKLIGRVILAMLMMLSAVGSGAAEKKLALVVGNATYVNALPLDNTVNDANDVCAALRKLDFEVLCKTNLATKREFKDAIFEFSGRINDQTIALFYYAGHGVQIDGLNYLVPTAAAMRTKSDIEDESVQINYLMNELDGRRAALNIFVLDACRNNPFINPIRGYAPALGLASQLYAPSNSIIAMSTGLGQLSLDGTGRNGTFTKNLLKFLPTPRQPIEDMFKAASGGTSVEARSLGHRQDPQVTTSYAGKFCLAGCSDNRLANDAELNAKAAQLDKLQAAIAQTRAKHDELAEQTAALLKKQAELDKLRSSVEQAQSGKGRDSVQQKNAVASVNAELSASTAKLAEMESMKAALLQKQLELSKILDTLAVQQAGIDDRNKEIRMRKLEVPAEDKKKQLNILPVF